MGEQQGENLSRRSIVLGLASVAGFAVACVIALWFFTREPPMAEQVTSPLQADRRARPVETAPARADPEPLPTSQPAATPAPEPQVELIVTPLFDTNTRFEVRKAAALTFRAQRGASLATGADISVSAFHMPDRKEARLPVREVGEGVYEAAFLPQEPGQFVLAMASRGLPARTNVPVSLSVVGTVAGTVGGTVAGTAAGAADGRVRASASASRSRHGALGGTATQRGR